MGKIQELGFELANMIAAGEVVNRPASAIKELCENSIDAGATRITVEIQNGGVLLMRVTDNGCGMEPEDLVLCVKRHATSKIKSAKDIDAIQTMGFRGEALAALSAVTEMRIISKTEDAECGHMLTVEYGNVTDICERAAGKGTTIVAENLFMNMPARRKFLKKDSSEAAAVIDCVEKLALSHPEIAFCVINDGSIRFETSGNGKLEDVIYKVYGKENARNLIKIYKKHEGVTVYGFIGTPMIHKVNRAYQAFFVNKRCVSSAWISSAVTNSYTSYIPSDRYPLAVLFIEVNPLLLDVNVHPTKQEVKFANEANVYAALTFACYEALSGLEKMPSLAGRTAAFPQDRSAARRSVSEEAAPLAVTRDKEGREVSSSLSKNQMSFELSGKENGTVKYDVSEQDSTGIEIEFDPGVIIPKQSDAATVKNSPPPTDNTAGATVKSDPENTVRYYFDSTANTYKTVSSLKNEDTPPSPPETATTVKNEAERISPTPEPSFEEKKTAVQAVNPDMPKEFLEPQKPLPRELFKYPPIAPGNTPTFEVRDGSYGTGVYAVYENGRNSYHRVIGELFNKYILVELVTRTGNKSFLIIDKHAAHERMLFEAMKESLERSERTSQLLLVPITADVGASCVSRIKRHKDKIENIGFRLEILDKKVNIWSLPSGVDTDDAEEILMEVLTAIESGVKGGKSLPEIFDKSLFTVACKAAVKGGRACDAFTVDAIARAVVTDAKIRFCPHGRPVVYEGSLEQLDASFKR